MTCSRVSRHALGLVALCAWLGIPGTSAAHFVLVSPASTFEQNALGDPQKAPPCGDQGTAVATGEVTALQAGDTITVTIDETIFHPGHYRIALALDDGIFPEEPPVTPGTTDCGSAPIDPAPAFPVLADGIWEHTEPFAEPQSIEITIPEGVSCTNCTLQVIQFMSNHGLNDPGGCYYHHCATLSVEPSAAETGTPADESGGSSDGGPATTTAGGTGDEGGNPGTSNGGSVDAGEAGGDNGDSSATAASETGDAGQAPASDEGCSCAVPQGGRMLPLLGLVGLLGLRRRRRP